MKYNKIISLKDGRECCLRNGTENDAQEVLDVFNLTHAKTDYLLTYPDENSFTVEQKGAFLKAKTESSNEIEIIAVVDGKIAGTAGRIQSSVRMKCPLRFCRVSPCLWRDGRISQRPVAFL